MPCAGFGFVRVNQTSLRAFFSLALVLFKKNSNQLKASAWWNLREPLLNTKEKKDYGITPIFVRNKIKKFYAKTFKSAK